MLGDLVDWQISVTGTVTNPSPQIIINYTVGTSGVGITGCSGGLAASSGNCIASAGTRYVTGTSDTLLAGDCGTGNSVLYSNTANQAITVPQAGSTGFPAGCRITLLNSIAGGLPALATTTSLFLYQSSTTGNTYWPALGLGDNMTLTSDGTNWLVQTTFPKIFFSKHTDNCQSAPATAAQTIGPSGSPVTCTQVSTATAFSSFNFTIPANVISANTQIRITDTLAATTGATNNIWTFGVTLAGSPLLTSAAGITPCSVGTVTNQACSGDIIIGGTGAVSGSVPVTATLHERGLSGTIAASQYFASVATSGPLALTQTGAYSGTNAGNWVDMVGVMIKWEAY